FNQRLDGINRNNNADVTQTQHGLAPADIRQRRGRGRPQKRKTKQTEEKKKETMADTIKGLAVVQHSSQSTLDLRSYIPCREELFSQGKIKKALYICHKESFNGVRGAEVGEASATLMNLSRRYALRP
ncbi:hypothetical protein M514_14239, partial [Trichuris suis]